MPAVPHTAKLTSMLRVTHATAGGAKRKHEGIGRAGREVSPTKSGQSWDQQSCSGNVGGSALAAAVAPSAGRGAQAAQRQGSAAQPGDDVARKVLKKMQRHRQKLLQQQLLRTER